MRQVEEAAFLKKSGAKNFCYTGAWALALPQPEAQINRSLLLLFFRKEVLPCLISRLWHKAA
jgi:hypothetical protein